MYSPDGDTQVGNIAKRWSGGLTELFTDSDFFTINFPMDLDVNAKATLLGALFLIVSLYLYFTIISVLYEDPFRSPIWSPYDI